MTPARSFLQSLPNDVQRTGEKFKPPPHGQPKGAVGQLLAWIRRRFDLQMGSLYRHLSRELPPTEGAVLDVGCGAQPFRPLFARASRYVGLDTADALAHFGYQVPDTLSYSGDRWPVDSQSFQLVLCTETLEHVPSPKAFLAEAFRSLAPGGRLVLSVPFAARWHFIPHDYWRFTPSGLNLLLEEAGFRQVHVVPRGNALTVASYKVMALFLPLLFPSGKGAGAWLKRAAGLLTFPVFAAWALVGNVSLLFSGGDDCLGYTAVALRP